MRPAVKREIGLDCSSTTIGWVLREGDNPRFFGTFALKGSIGKRCLDAHTFVTSLLEAWQPERIVVETPVARFAKAVIPQARVNGAVIAAAQAKGILVFEVTPAQGKKALTGKGTAGKPEMIEAAGPYLGYTAVVAREQKRDYWVALVDGQQVYDEHAADAVGVVLAGDAGKLL